MTIQDEKIAALELRVQVLEAATASRPKATETVEAWPLDSERGDFEVQKAPPLWIKAGNENFAGRLSQLTAAQCEAVADLREWQAKQDAKSGKLAGNGKPTSHYKLMDAASARGWAERHRRPTDDGQPFKPQKAKAHVEAQEDESGEFPF